MSDQVIAQLQMQMLELSLLCVIHADLATESWFSVTGTIGL